VCIDMHRNALETEQQGRPTEEVTAKKARGN
jgi:hypothetical protein